MAEDLSKNEPPSKQARAKSAFVLIAVGFILLLIGLGDGIIVSAIGTDFGRLWSFWYRLVAEAIGLGAIFIGMALCLERGRQIFIFVCGIAVVWLVLTPGYYVVVDGPLNHTSLRPIDVLRDPSGTLGRLSR